MVSPAQPFAAVVAGQGEIGSSLMNREEAVRKTVKILKNFEVRVFGGYIPYSDEENKIIQEVGEQIVNAVLGTITQVTLKSGKEE